jgi:hypothetical protein
LALAPKGQTLPTRPYCKPGARQRGPTISGAYQGFCELDLPRPCRLVLDTMLRDGSQGANRFHLIKLVNGTVDECRPRAPDDAPGRRADDRIAYSYPDLDVVQ